LKSRSKYLLTASLVVTLTVGVVIWREWKKRAALKREARYEATADAYSKEFPTGSLRRDVEKALKSKAVQFGRVGNLYEKSAMADLIEIGQEDTPWTRMCDHVGVYIEFDFAAREVSVLGQINETYALIRVTVFHWLQDCT